MAQVTANCLSTPTSEKAVVLAVELNDAPHIREMKDLQDLFSTAKSYFAEASYNSYNIEFTIYGWYRIDKTTASYGRDSQLSIDDPDVDGTPDTCRLIQDTINLADADVDFRQFRYLVVVHSGSGQECTGKTEDIWSCAYLMGIWFRSKEESFSKAAIVPETQVRGGNPIGVIVHEFGHLLGLPDLYSTNEQVGPWDVMGRGTWRGYPAGAIPALLCAWNRIRLGWLDETHVHVFKGNFDVVTLTPVAIRSREVKVVKIPLKDGSYYFVEYRVKVGFDSALPQSGVLISRVRNTSPYVAVVKYLDRQLDEALWPSGSILSDPNEDVFIGISMLPGGNMEILVSVGSRPPIFSSPIPAS
jgi:M6 family metalloprotease-like protein